MAKTAVLSILQLILVFRIDLKFLLHLILLILLSVFPNTSRSLCKCDISSGTKSCIFLRGNTKPWLAGSPRTQPLSTVLLFALPPRRPSRNMAPSCEPQRSAESSLTGTAVTPTGTHWRPAPSGKPQAHALPWRATPGRGEGGGAEAVRRTAPNTVTHTHAARRFLRTWPLSRLNSEESSRRKDTRHRGLAWRGRCSPRADGSGRPGSPRLILTHTSHQGREGTDTALTLP